MKKFYTLLLFTSFLFLNKESKAQWVNIPDANFVSWLNTHGFSGAMSGSMMDTTNAAVISTKNLYCNNTSVTNLNGIQYFDSLVILSCSMNFNLTSLPSLPKLLTHLDCGYNALTSLPILPDSLSYLACQHNQLTALPSLPVKLATLYCGYNLITNLPALPFPLADLECEMNQIDSLPLLPGVLTTLYCNFNQLTRLPTLPNSLITLDCNNNQLDSLPTLPNSITVLHCFNNQLTSLPTLPNSLTFLTCYNNLLVNLPALPNLLTDLRCYQNQLTSLPLLPNSLTYLYCYQNQLTSLPPLSDSLIYLDCGNNQLTNLPTLPNLLITLYCNNNQLTSLPDLPNSLQTLYCHSNPNLNCLPDLKNVISLYISNSGCSCLPNYGRNNQLYGAFNGYPICGIFSNNNCPYYWNISGVVHIDADSSCTYNATDFPLKNIRVELWRNSILEQQVFTLQDGSYNFDVGVYDTFQIKVDTSNLPFYLNCPAQQVLTSIISAIDSTDGNRNFAMQCKTSVIDIVAQNIFTNGQRPGGLAHITVAAGFLNSQYGYSCNTPISGNVKLYKNGPMKFISNGYYSITPNIISADSLIWYVSNFDSFPGYISFESQIDTTALIGQSICYTLIVEPTITNSNTTNDTLLNCLAITNGYDPNIKSVLPNNIITLNQINLTYAIQFQNTGNDTAINIIVRDTLSPFLNVNTLKITHYNFKPVTQTFGNIIVFNFPHINLVDSSTNEVLSHGFVDFTIERFPNLSIGSIIPNKAAIYFDFNPPIYTNTTTNIISNLNCSANYFAFSQSICSNQTFSFNGNNLNIGGTYYDTLTNYTGCDSIITLNLTVNQTSSSSFSHNICPNQTFSFNGNNLSIGGTYYDTLTNYTGCDSIITLNLTTAPATLISNGTVFICSGISFTTNDTIRNQSGCDSIVTHTFHQVVSIDTAVTIHNDTLMSNAFSFPAYQYQWKDCSTGAAIAGANQSFYVAPISGNYQLVINDTFRQCIDSSACKTITVIDGISTVANEDRLTLYPNPVGNQLSVIGYQLLGNANTIQVIDVLGRECIVLFPLVKGARGIELNVSKLTDGVYFLKLTDEKGNIRMGKFVKE